ncbi:MerC family mercury resistance protein [Acidibrevibacterium fodinaquatile]|uniref:MerC family mercury resistance protein n=1 Tax=Acidibrevibacterium fodinaquatile TaxID=1969806 RepID=UPI0013B3BD2E|nr:MerC family mercury resistance protein [Acidibrevibacterium fodinaquatile]
MMKASTQLEQIVSVGRGKWLAPAGTAMAMLACYGVTAVIGLLSLIGISVALPFRAPIIILFSAIAAAGLLGSYKRHHSRAAVVLGLAGFILIAGSKFLPPNRKAEALVIEGVGFTSMLVGNFFSFRARRLAGASCTVPRMA